MDCAWEDNLCGVFLTWQGQGHVCAGGRDVVCVYDIIMHTRVDGQPEGMISVVSLRG